MPILFSQKYPESGKYAPKARMLYSIPVWIEGVPQTTRLEVYLALEGRDQFDSDLLQFCPDCPGYSTEDHILADEAPVEFVVISNAPNSMPLCASAASLAMYTRSFSLAGFDIKEGSEEQ